MYFYQNQDGAIAPIEKADLSEEQLSFIERSIEALKSNGVSEPYGALVGKDNILIAKIKVIRNLSDRAITQNHD